RTYSLFFGLGGRINYLFAADAGGRSRTTKTRSVFDRSPMIFFIGWGRFLTQVGMAMIWSPRANWGFSSRSINSMRYLSARCSAQIFLRFAKAVIDFGVCPAT